MTNISKNLSKSNLKEVIEAVKEDSLSKNELEAYHTAVTNLAIEMEQHMANIEKLSALYYEDNKLDEANNIVRTDVAIKRMWAVTPFGQKEIQFKRDLKVTGLLLRSLKTKLYGIAY